MLTFHVLTAILFLLKVLGVLTISWWLVAAPSIISVGIGLITLTCIAAGIIYSERK